MIVGSQAVGVSPVENNGQASGANGTGDTAHIAAIIDYAHRQQKKIVLLLMRSPYDIIHFDGKTDAIVATYAYYGLDNGVRRGELLFAAARALVGELKPSGKLPVNIYNVDPQGAITDIHAASVSTADTARGPARRRPTALTAPALPRSQATARGFNAAAPPQRSSRRPGTALQNRRACTVTSSRSWYSCLACTSACTPFAANWSQSRRKFWLTSS